MTAVFPVADPPWTTMPPLVGRGDDKCSRTSRKSHFRPTNVFRRPLWLLALGTSKKSGFKGHSPPHSIAAESVFFQVFKFMTFISILSRYVFELLTYESTLLLLTFSGCISEWLLIFWKHYFSDWWNHLLCCHRHSETFWVTTWSGAWSHFALKCFRGQSWQLGCCCGLAFETE